VADRRCEASVGCDPVSRVRACVHACMPPCMAMCVLSSMGVYTYTRVCVCVCARASTNAGGRMCVYLHGLPHACPQDAGQQQLGGDCTSQHGRMGQCQPQAITLCHPLLMTVTG
jgi:hypothetical protein